MVASLRSAAIGKLKKVGIKILTPQVLPVPPLPLFTFHVLGEPLIPAAPPEGSTKAVVTKARGGGGDCEEGGGKAGGGTEEDKGSSSDTSNAKDGQAKNTDASSSEDLANSGSTSRENDLASEKQQIVDDLNSGELSEEEQLSSLERLNGIDRELSNYPSHNETGETNLPGENMGENESLAQNGGPPIEAQDNHAPNIKEEEESRVRIKGGLGNKGGASLGVEGDIHKSHSNLGLGFQHESKTTISASSDLDGSDAAVTHTETIVNSAGDKLILSKTEIGSDGVKQGVGFEGAVSPDLSVGTGGGRITSKKPDIDVGCVYNTNQELQCEVEVSIAGWYFEAYYIDKDEK